MNFTAYQSQVLKKVSRTKDAMLYTRLRGFFIGTITNIIADGWKDIEPINTTADKVIAYIETLEK